MTFTITLKPSGQVFTAQADEPILEAAKRKGIILPYSCKNGICGSCKGKVLKGQVAQAEHSASALSNDEKAAGLALFCCATAQTDLELEIHELTDALAEKASHSRKFPARVCELERTMADDVMIVKLQLPAGPPVEYVAGQYIDFILKDGKRRSYSIATAPHHKGPMELHIRHMPGGAFTDHVFSSMKTREILRCEGPLGTFFLREDSSKPIILLASGTGFAPIKAIVEHVIFKNIQRPITLYWGGRRKKDLYLFDLANHWADTLPNFSFIPVLSDTHDEAWHGRTGFVHQAVIDDLPDLSAYQVYACGAPVMVEAALRNFVAHHQLPPDEFYADAFTSALNLVNPI